MFQGVVTMLKISGIAGAYLCLRGQPVERRLLPRYSVDWPVKLTGRGNIGIRYFEEGVLENIGAKGACLYTNKSLQVGERLDISIKLPLERDNWLIYSARVIRVEDVCPQARVAIKFDSPMPAFTDK
jgi:hypothetical protein